MRILSGGGLCGRITVTEAILQMLLGTRPPNELKSNLKEAMLLSNPNSLGIIPLKQLRSNAMIVARDRLPRLLGMVPRKAFFCKAKTRMFFHSPTVDGTVPEMLLAFTAKLIMESTNVTEAGRDPEKQLELKVMVTKFDNFPKLLGKLPNSLFESNCKKVKDERSPTLSGIVPARLLPPREIRETLFTEQLTPDQEHIGISGTPSELQDHPTESAVFSDSAAAKSHIDFSSILTVGTIVGAAVGLLVVGTLVEGATVGLLG